MRYSAGVCGRPLPVKNLFTGDMDVEDATHPQSQGDPPMRVTLFSKLTSASTGDPSPQPLPLNPWMRLPARPTHLVLCLLSAFLFACSLATGHAEDKKHVPDYTSIVVFGDSLSDTRNVADLTEAKYGFQVPGPIADYTVGRFTDGADTEPPAEKYFGVWIEQLAATFPSKPKIKASLDGGTDYAYGFAFTGKGTSVFAFGPSDVYSVTIKNIGQQISDYLATHPKITDKTLFVVWGGANDLLNATSDDDVIDAGINQAVNIQRLIDAGATQFIIPNLPPLGLIPRLNGSPTTSVPATEAAKLFNEVLGGGIDVLRAFNSRKHVKLAQLDVFALFNQIVADPAKYSLVNVTDSSQGIAVDPDTYLFWDDLHPTTHGHNILAVTAGKVIAKDDACVEDTVPARKSLTDLDAECHTEFATDAAGATR
jgi:phospholipase/lecithinase/hemolysin